MLRVDDRGVGGSTGEHLRRDERGLRRRRPGGGRLPQGAPGGRPADDRPDRPQRGGPHRADRRGAVAATSRSSSCWPARASTATRSSPQGRLIAQGRSGRRGRRATCSPTGSSSRLLDVVKAEKDPKAAADEADRGHRKEALAAMPEAEQGAGARRRVGPTPSRPVQHPLVPLLPDLRPAADPRQGPLPGPGDQRREGPAGPRRGKPRRDREGPQGGGQHAVHDPGAARPEPPLPDLQDRLPAEYATIEETIAPRPWRRSAIGSSSRSAALRAGA